MNMWIITCGKQHDLGRLKGSDGLFIDSTLVAVMS